MRGAFCVCMVIDNLETATEETEAAYAEYVKDRRIFIVGGKDNYYSPGRRIDSSDIIVRTNNHWIRQGGQCDVVYHTVTSTNLHLDELAKAPGFAPDFMFMNRVDWDYEYGESKHRHIDYFLNNYDNPKTKVGFFTQASWGKPNPYHPVYEWLNIIQERYNAIFFTGLVALAHVLRYNPKQIFLIGMTLFSENETVERFQGVHWLPGNIDFVKAMRKDPRVILDTPLLEALDIYERNLQRTVEK